MHPVVFERMRDSEITPINQNICQSVDVFNI